jgi:precorrin-6B methylase 2
MTDEEINLASISESDSIVHIGCGSVPASSILIAQKKNAKVIGIDKDINAVKNADLCVKKIGLNEKIKIRHSEASDFDFYNFDVILISQGITLNDIFLKNLSKISKNTRIIFRTFSSETGDLDESDIILENIFDVKKIVKHEKHGKVISVMLKVK